MEQVFHVLIGLDSRRLRSLPAGDERKPVRTAGHHLANAKSDLQRGIMRKRDDNRANRITGSWR